MLRRKSGSCIKQHIKLMPVRDSSGFVSHHVTIRRQLSSQEIRATMFNSGEGGRERGREGEREGWREGGREGGRSTFTNRIFLIPRYSPYDVCGWSVQPVIVVVHTSS